MARPRPVGSGPPITEIIPALPVTAILDGEPVGVSQAYAIPGAIGQFLVDISVPYDNPTESGAQLEIIVGNAMTQLVSISILGQPDDSSSDSISMVRRARKRPLPPVR